MQSKGTALRKRTQIAMANRTMFMWVAGVSVVFGFALVATIFLTQMMMFNERVLAEKGKTVQTLRQNNANAKELESQIRALDANQDLINAKASPDDHALQVILDALPSEANWPALGSSIQYKLLAGINNLTLDDLKVDPVVIEGSDSVIVNASSTSSGENQITFRFVVTGGETELKQVLANLERSIRTIDVQTLKIESAGAGKETMTVQGRAFYEPAMQVELRDKTVK